MDPSRIESNFVLDSRKQIPGMESERLPPPITLEECMEAGVFCIKFYKEGSWIPVVIDTEIPVNWNNKPVFGRSKIGHEFWISLIEKAYAKLHGSYECIVGGHTSAALADLTGGGADRLNLLSDKCKRDISSGHLWKQLLDFFQSGYLVGAGSIDGEGGDRTKVQGIALSHAYAMLNVIEVDNHQLVHLRNPWGSGEWTGDFSDKSPKWTARLKAKVGFVDSEDGAFWMPFKDFCRMFDTVYVCRLFTGWTKKEFKNQWKGNTSGGRENGKLHKNPQYLVRASRKTKVFIQLSQFDLNDIGFYSRSSKVAIGLKLIKKNGNRVKTIYVGECHSSADVFIYSEMNSLETTISASDGPLTLLPMPWNEGDEARFSIVIFSEHPLEVSELDTSVPAS